MSPSILDTTVRSLGEARVQDTGEMGSAQGCRTTSFRARTSQSGHSRPDWLERRSVRVRFASKAAQLLRHRELSRRVIFRPIWPVLPLGSCRLRPERGPEAGRDGQKRVEVSRANGFSTRFRQRVDGSRRATTSSRPTIWSSSSSHQYGRGCALVSLRATP